MSDGDICIFQREIPPEEAKGLRFPDVLKYLDYIRSRWGWEVKGKEGKVWEDLGRFNLLPCLSPLGVFSPPTLKSSFTRCFSGSPPDCTGGW